MGGRAGVNFSQPRCRCLAGQTDEERVCPDVELELRVAAVADLAVAALEGLGQGVLADVADQPHVDVKRHAAVAALERLRVPQLGGD